MINEIRESHGFIINFTKVNIYLANQGEGLPKHQHTWDHSTMCCAGKIAIRKENLYMEMTKESQPIILSANEWHEIEALENDTVFVNVFAEGKY